MENFSGTCGSLSGWACLREFLYASSSTWQKAFKQYHFIRNRNFIYNFFFMHEVTEEMDPYLANGSIRTASCYAFLGCLIQSFLAIRFWCSIVRYVILYNKITYPIRSISQTELCTPRSLHLEAEDPCLPKGALWNSACRLAMSAASWPRKRQTHTC